MTEPLRRQPRAIARPAIPLSPNLPGADFVPRIDRILQHLSREGDEREWQRMIDSSDAISSAIRQRQQGLLSDGWEIRPGDSGSPRADELQDFVSAAFARTELRWHLLLPEILDVVFYGWRPIEVLYDAEMSWNGRPVLTASRLIARKPWQFKFLREGTELAYLPTGTLPDGKVFPLPGNPPLRFLTPSSGESESPYGRSWLSPIWLLWFTVNQFRKMSSTAIKRALGLFKAIRQGGTIADSEVVATAGIDDSLRTILRTLDANSILVEAGGWSLEKLDSAPMGGEMREFWRYFDEQLRIGIVGQTLTSQMQARGGGSFAAAKEHSKVLDAYQRADAQFLSSALSVLIRTLVDVNFGPQAADDYPVWHPLKFQPFDLDVARFAYEAGAQIDAEQLAKRGAPLILGEPPEDADVLVKPASPASAPQMEPGAGPSPPDEQPDSAARRAQDPGADDAASLLAGFAGGPELARLYASAAQRLLDGNPDP